MAETKLTLKLLVDTKAHKVLFAEANKDFVDFLFHILSLPIGTVVNLLEAIGTVGCLADLYKSVGSLSSNYWQANVNRELVLNPRTIAVPLLSLKSNDAPITIISKKLYQCSTHPNYITDRPDETCRSCELYEVEKTMSQEVTYVGSGDIATASTNDNISGGYVKEVVTYMIMDNLEVKPMSTISGITLINKFNVKDVSALVEKQIQVGLSQGLEILKASLETQAVLTNVFLEKMILLLTMAIDHITMQQIVKWVLG